MELKQFNFVYFTIYFFLTSIYIQIWLAQSAGAVEYTHQTSVLDVPVMLEYPFIIIDPRSSLTRSGSIW